MAGDAPDTVVQLSWLYHPSFPAHWTREQLYALAQWVNGVAFRDIQFSVAGKPVIKIAEIKTGIGGQTKFTQQTFDEAVHVMPGDMLFSWSGQPDSSIDVSWWHGPEGWLNQHIFRVTPREDLARSFFYYLLRYLRPNFVAIASNKQTTGLGHVTRRDLENIEVAYPPLKEQRAIACILGALDDKIELNRRMNQTLEAMARAIFKSWFVDFDPVRARAAGQPPPGLTPDLAALFPDSFEDSELGKIPKGWRVVGLSEIGTFQNGLALQKFPAGDGESLPVIKIAQLRKGDTEGADRARADIDSAYVVADGDVLFSWSGSLECVLWTGGPGALNQHLFKVTSDRFPKWFYYLWIHEHLPAFRHIAAGKATTMGHIQRHHLSEAKVTVPLPAILTKADQVIEPLIDAVISRALECCRLETLRDALLPKLISGELRVPDAERIVGRCV